MTRERLPILVPAMITLLLLSFILPTPLGPGSVTADDVIDDINDMMCIPHFNSDGGRSSSGSSCYCSPDSGECRPFLPGGGNACTPLDPDWFLDTDGDGTNDCEDNDDDNDHLTDRLEFYYSGSYDSKRRDTDEDGVRDAGDVVPILANAAQIAITFTKYNEDGCDPESAEPADPFIPAGEFNAQIASGGWIELEIPTGWSEANHVDDRGDDVVQDLTMNSIEAGDMVGGLMDLPESIMWYSLQTTTEMPSVTVHIGLMDHDAVYDDRMDMMTGSESIASIKVTLDNDDPTALFQQGGSDTCHGQIGYQKEDNIKSCALAVAMYYRQNPGALIDLSDVDC